MKTDPQTTASISELCHYALQQNTSGIKLMRPKAQLSKGSMCCGQHGDLQILSA